MLVGFIKDFFRAFYSPRALYEKISREHRHSSWLCVLIYCSVYVIGSLRLYWQGFEPFIIPSIELPDDRYYLVQAHYIIPLVFLMWISGTGVLHLLSKLFGGKGKFDVLLIMTGYSLWAPLYPLMIVDCIHSTPAWLHNAVLAICIIFILTGTTIAAMVEERIRLPGAASGSIATFSSIGLILFTYID